MVLFKCDNCNEGIALTNQSKAFTISMIPVSAGDIKIEKTLFFYGEHACCLQCLGEVVKNYVL